MIDFVFAATLGMLLGWRGLCEAESLHGSITPDVPISAPGVTAAPGDIVRGFPSPDGRVVDVIVKHPTSKTSVYKMRAIRNGELPDCYFPLALKLAVAAGASELVIPKGTYDFQHPASGQLICPDGGPQISPGFAHWTLIGLKDFSINGSGAALNFNRPGYGVQIKSVQRLIFGGFSIDWPNLAIASHGRIGRPVSGDRNQTLAIDPSLPVNASTILQAVNVWDDTHNTWDGSQSRKEIYFPNLNCGMTFSGFSGANKCYRYLGGQAFSSAHFNQFAVGTPVLVRHHIYDGYAFDVNSSNDIDIHDVNILTGPGMGFVVDNDDPELISRGIRFSNCSVNRGPRRLISTAADALHVSAISGDVIIENSELAFNGDDILNITGISRPVVGVSGRHVTVSKAAFVNVDDVFAFFAADCKTKSDFGYLGSARITEVAPDGSNSVLTLDARISGLSQSAITINQTRQMSVRYYIQNNSFHDNRGKAPS